MSTLKLLLDLKRAEREAGLLYRDIALRTSESDQGTAQLFLALSEDENSHMQQLDYLKNCFHQAESALREIPGAQQAAQDVLDTISREREFFENRAETLGVDELVQIAIRIETEMEARHHDFYVEFSDPQLKQLFSSLSNWDRDHRARLERYLKSRA